MKNLTRTLFALVFVFISLTGHAAGRIDLSKPVVNQQVIAQTIKQADEYGGTCDCFCTNGTWVCNEPSCGMHGSGCDAGGTSVKQLLDKKATINARTLPGDQLLPKALPGDQSGAKPRLR